MQKVSQESISLDKTRRIIEFGLSLKMVNFPPNLHIWLVAKLTMWMKLTVLSGNLFGVFASRQESFYLDGNAFKNALQVRKLLFNKSLSNNALCPICETHEESALYALFHCNHEQHGLDHIWVAILFHSLFRNVGLVDEVI